MSTKCDNYNPKCNLAFDPNKSETYKSADRVETITYGSGYLAGEYGTDEFRIGSD
jgi:hypothetical protein